MVGRYCIVSWKFNFNLYTPVLKVSTQHGAQDKYLVPKKFQFVLNILKKAIN